MPQTLLRDRYGPPPSAKRRRVWRVFITAVIAVALGSIVWAAFSITRTDVTWQEVGFSIKGDHAIDLTFDVSYPPGSVLRCTLEALNHHYAQVGIRDVDLGPETERIIRYRETIATQELAVTAVIRTCRIVEPALS